MDKINCDIIQDLIPSYVDKICSNSSKQWIDEHLTTCNDCKIVLNLYRENDFSIDEIENKQLDGYKKIKSKIKQQNIISYGLLLVLILLATYTLQSNSNNIPSTFYYVLFPVCMVGTYFLNANHLNLLKIGKFDFILSMVSFIANGYSIIMLNYCISAFNMDKLPFGIATEKIGPFIHNQWEFLLILQLLIYGYMLTRLLRKNIDCHWILCLNLTGVFLLLSYVTILAKLQSYEAFHHDFVQMTMIILVIGMIGIAFHIYNGRKKESKNKYL